MYPTPFLQKFHKALYVAKLSSGFSHPGILLFSCNLQFHNTSTKEDMKKLCVMSTSFISWQRNKPFEFEGKYPGSSCGSLTSWAGHPTKAAALGTCLEWALNLSSSHSLVAHLSPLPFGCWVHDLGFHGQGPVDKNHDMTWKNKPTNKVWIITWLEMEFTIQNSQRKIKLWWSTFLPMNGDHSDL